jgi:hypothetical protein
MGFFDTISSIFWPQAKTPIGAPHELFIGRWGKEPGFPTLERRDLWVTDGDRLRSFPYKTVHGCLSECVKDPECAGTAYDTTKHTCVHWKEMRGGVPFSTIMSHRKPGHKRPRTYEDEDVPQKVMRLGQKKTEKSTVTPDEKPVEVDSGLIVTEKPVDAGLGQRQIETTLHTQTMNEDTAGYRHEMPQPSLIISPHIGKLEYDPSADPEKQLEFGSLERHAFKHGVGLHGKHSVVEIPETETKKGALCFQKCVKDEKCRGATFNKDTCLHFHESLGLKIADGYPQDIVTYMPWRDKMTCKSCTEGDGGWECQGCR